MATNPRRGVRYQNGCAGRRSERWTFFLPADFYWHGVQHLGALNPQRTLSCKLVFEATLSISFVCVCVWRRITSASFSGIFGSVAAFLLSLICMPHVKLRSCFLLNCPDLNWLAHVSYIPHIYTHCQSCESLICVFWGKHTSRRRIKGGERATLILLWV